jgi:hypothetical protein
MTTKSSLLSAIFGKNLKFKREASLTLGTSPDEFLDRKRGRFGQGNYLVGVRGLLPLEGEIGAW